MKATLLTLLKQRSTTLLLILLVSFCQVTAQQTFTTNQDADLVVGQSSFTTSTTTVTQSITPRPAYCAISSKGVLAVAEATSPVGGRVMIWNNAVTTIGPAADVVIGKPSFTNSSNGTTQSIMSGCTGVAFSPDGNKLIVSDGPNHRVLIWNSIPTTNGQNADVVIGQANFTTANVAVSTTALNNPAGVFVAPNGKLFICDQGNNRVLVYNKIPTTNNVAADLVVGQAIFTSATSSDAADKLDQPRGVWVSNDGKLLIADQENNRVVVFNSVPASNGASADVVIGQSAFNTSGNGTTASQFFRPIGVTVSPYGQLAIGELGNDRVLLYNSIPLVNGAAANVVLGQPNFTSNGNCSGLTAKKTCDVQNVSYDINGRLFVPGMGMSRVLIFGTRPTLNTDLQITLSALSSTLCNGNEVRYIITVKNNGPDLATDIVSTSALPALFNLSTSSATTGTYNNAGSYWNIPSLASGASAVLTLTGSVATATPQQLSVYASVIAVDQLDPDMSNNGISVTTTVSSGSSPSGGTLSGIASAAPGQPVTFTLSGVTNATGYAWNVTGGTSVVPSGNTVSFIMGNSNATVNAQAYNTSCAGSVFSQVITSVSNSITTGTITSSLCEGANINVPYSAYGTFDGGNIFTAQLSDASGNFPNQDIGSLSSAASGTISTTIPLLTPAGTGYRIRVVASNPATTGGDNGSNISINTLPVITCPANISVSNAPGQCSAPVSFNATATGTPAPSIAYSHASGSTFNVGTVTVTATATNSCGSSSCTFTVTVADNQNPVISAGSIATCYQTTAAAEAAAIAATSATDNCAGTIALTANTSGTCSAIVTVTATDASGNSASTAYNTRIDNTPPSIACAANAIIDCPAIPVWTLPTATDACGTSTVAQLGAENVTGSCPTVYTRTYIATDDCGNTATCSRSVTVRDITPPAITCAANAIIDCPAVPVWTLPTATDACSTPTVAQLGAENITGSCPTVYTRTYIATDDCGNTATCSRSVTVRDITPPSITCPANATIDCPAIPTWPAVTATDACDLNVVIVFNETTSGTCPTVYTRTYLATDDCGNTSSCSRSVTVRDITPPAITCAANAIIDCPALPTWPLPTATDACGTPTVAQLGAENITGSCPTVYTRTYIATDDCGNTSTCSRSVTVRDITPPSIACAANAIIDCPAVPVWPLPTASDACGTPTVAQLGAENVTGSCPTVYTRTYIATDDCGNTSTCSRSVTVRDITAPSITCAANAIIDCPAIPVWALPTATDACDLDVDITLVGETSAGTCPTVYTRTYIATDDCGNTTTCSRSVTVRDITPPSITCAANAIIDCPAVPVWPLPTATDACSTPTVAQLGAENITGTCPTVYTRTYIATDDCGNTATCSRSITVRDITPPAIACAANATIDCPAIPVWTLPTATDACSTPTVAQLGAENITGSCPTVYTRTYIATDDCGNTATCSRSVTVRDITPPAIACAANATIDCPALPTWPLPTASDACGTPTVAQLGAENVTGSCPTVYTRTYIATDDCGNTSTCSRSVTVRDITPPSITCAANATIDCPAVPVWPLPTASDACGTPTVAQLGAENVTGSCPTVYTRTYIATDDCGNTATCSRSVTVRDITAPSITCAANATIDCPAVPAWPLPTATDACGTPTVAQLGAENVSGSCPTVYTRTYIATDDCGNTATCSRSVTVRDITAPSITCAANATIDCPAVPAWPLPTATDACSTPTVAQLGAENVTGICPTVYTRTYIATDDCGNTATCSRSVTVRDITPPAIACPANATIDCPALPTWPAVTATDACDLNVVIVFNETTSGICPTVYTRTYLATDDCGNTSSCSRSVTVRDITPPAITCPANATIDCPALPTWPAVTATDACDLNVVIIFNETTSGTCPTVYTRTYLATDDCGNTSSCSRSVTVRDITPPSITCAANATIDCPAIPVWALPTATDACGTPTVAQLGAENITGSCPTVYTRTYIATDDCGNTATCSRSVTVRDITPPSITCAANATIDCPAIPVWALPTATDACSTPTVAQLGAENITGSCPTVYTRTYIATDDCGNTATCSRSVTVRDITLPSINCAANAIIDCPAVLVWTLPTATDACSTPTVAQLGAENITGTCPTVYTRTYRATDACGNTATCSRSVTVRDITPPAITCPTNITVNNASNQCGAAVSYSVAASDACSSPVLSYSTAPGSFFPIGTTSVTARATDACGNTSTCTFTVTVADNQPPTAICQNITVQLSPAGTASITAAQINNGSTDNCGIATTTVSPSTFNCTNIAGAPITNLFISEYIEGSSNNKAIEIYNGTGAAINLSAGGYAIRIYSNGSTSPSSTTSLTGTVAPGDVFVISNNSANATILAQSDQTSGNISFNGNDAVELIKAGPITLDIFGTIGHDPGTEWGSGLVSTADNTLRRKSNVTSGITTNPGPGFPSLASQWDGFATDNSANLGSHSASGANPVTLTVTDVNGNSSTCTALVTVQDVTPPVAACQNITVQLNAAGTVSITAAQVNNSSSDACGIASMSVSPSSFTCANVGANTVTLTVTDANGLTSTCSATVTVQDVTPPVANCQNLTVQLNAAGIASITAAQINNGSTDGCGVQSLTVSPLTFNCSDVAGDPVTDLIISEYVEGSGNNKYIEIYNGTPSSINLSDYQLRNYSNGASTPNFSNTLSGTLAPGATAIYKNTSALIYGGAATVLTSVVFNGDDAMVLFKISTNSFVDIFGRIGEDPGTEWSAGGNLTIDKTLRRKSSVISGVTTNPAAGFPTLAYEWDQFNTDDVSGLGTHNMSGSNKVTLTVTDFNGNSSTCTAAVIVQDLIAPSINCPSNTTVNTDPGQCNASVATANPVTSDNCTISKLTWAISGASGGSSSPTGINYLGTATFNKGVSTVTYIVTDASGNTASCSSTVTVNDNENPVLHGCPISFSSCNPISWTPPTATDNCSALVSSNLLPGVFPSGTTTVIYTATDPSGNSATCSFVVTVLEPSAPAINITSDHANNQFCTGDSVTLTLHGGSLGHLAEWKWYSGACGGTLVASNTTTIKVAPQFATTYYVRAEGYCNTTNCVAITVINGSIFQTSVAAAIPSAICEDATSLLNAIFTVRTNPALLITEITQDGSSANGATSPRPSYFGASDDDFIEISNLSNSTVGLSSVTFELWSGTLLNRTYTFPGSASIAGHGVLVLHIGSGLDSPTDNYYHTGGSTNSLTAGTAYGYLLKSGSAVLDAAASNGYSWPLAAGVTVASWSGTMVSNAGSAGSIRIGYIDNNNGDDWITADNSIRQSLGTYNGNYASNSQPAFTYIWNPTTYLDDPTSSTPTVSGAAPGVYVYNVTATNPESGCSSTASAGLTVYALPTASISGDAEICVGSTTSLTFNFTGAGPFIYTFSDGTNTYGPFTSASLSDTRFVTPSGSGSASVVYTLLSVSDIHCNGILSGSAVITFDQVAPSFSGCPSDFVACNPVTWTPPTASDNCAVSLVNSNYLPGDLLPAGTTTVTYVATDSNGNTSACSFNVTLSNVPPTFSGCPSSFSSCNPVTWTPPVASGTCSIASVSSNYIPGATFPSGTTTVTYIATDSNGNTAECSFNVTVLNASSITGADITANRPYNNICVGDNATLTVSGGTLGAGAQWRWYSGSCNGTLIASGVTSITVNPVVSTTYFAKIAGTCNTTACVSLQLIVSTAPPTATPTVFYAPTITYQGAVDSIILNPVSGATFYRWTSNGNAQLLFNGQPAPYETSVPKVVITFINPSTQGNGIGNYHVQFVAGNACGRSTTAGNVRIRATVAQPTTLSGPLVACPGQTKIYTVSAVVGAKTYQWSLTPSGAGNIVGNGTQTVSVTFAAGFTSASLCVHGVTAFNTIGPDLCLTVSTIPSAPTTITGNPTPCPSSQATYIATPVIGAISYTWTVPLGASIVSVDSNTVVVQFPALFSGQVCVKANSGCGLSAPSCLTVAPGEAPPLGTITGPQAGVCGLNGINYQVPSSGALTYVWTTPAGATIASGQGTNSVLINFGSNYGAGNISIIASNLCGATPGSLPVTGAPGTPVISSDNPAGNYACGGIDVWTYTATSSGGNTYSWYVHPDSGNIIPTIYPNAIMIEWLTNGANVSVVAHNDCGESDSVTVTVSASCAPRLSSGTGMITGLQAKVFPNPNDGKSTLQLNSGEETTYQLNITDLAGRKLRTESLKVMEGSNSFDLDLSAMAKGVYMLSLDNASGRSSVIRIVVE